MKHIRAFINNVNDLPKDVEDIPEGMVSVSMSKTIAKRIISEVEQLMGKLEEMRKHQKEFFKSKLHSPERKLALQESISCELEIDALIKEYNQPIPNESQGKIDFPEVN